MTYYFAAIQSNIRANSRIVVSVSGVVLPIRLKVQGARLPTLKHLSYFGLQSSTQPGDPETKSQSSMTQSKSLCYGPASCRDAPGHPSCLWGNPSHPIALAARFQSQNARSSPAYGSNKTPAQAKLHPKGSDTLPRSHTLSPRQPVPEKVLSLYEAANQITYYSHGSDALAR